MTGKLYCVGIGPGDPELVTLKAVAVIRDSTTIFVPVTSRKSRSLAHTILKEVFSYAGIPDKRVVELVFPMTRDQTVLEKAWEQNAQKIANSTSKNSKSSYVVLGDPMVYSTFGHIHKKLMDLDVEVEFVPGVSSITACPAKTGMILAEGNETLLIAPPEKLELIKRNLGYVDTFIIIKTAVNVDTLLQEIETAGAERGARVLYARRCTMKGEEQYVEGSVSNWQTEYGKEGDYFSMLIVKTHTEKKIEKEIL